ncbi:MAG: hypothetical protein AAB629_02200 [Patescibacteria group bacterium]
MLDSTSGPWGMGLDLIPAVILFAIWLPITLNLLTRKYISNHSIKILVITIVTLLVTFLFASTLSVFSYRLEYGSFHQCWYRFSNCGQAWLDNVRAEDAIIQKWHDQCQVKYKYLWSNTDNNKWISAINTCYEQRPK